jgi:hypothetical protein
MFWLDENPSIKVNIKRNIMNKASVISIDTCQYTNQDKYNRHYGHFKEVGFQPLLDF